MGLAQTFGNVEFLGCQYPAETMEQIQELSQVEEALSNAHTVLAEDNEKRNGPWPTVPPIRARPESKPRTPPSR